MKLTFLGGADEVGASSTLIEIAGKKLLVDVGIRISPKTVKGISGDQLPDLQQVSDADGPDFILVTHAHTDHTGALPLVLERYPHAPVFATEPTIALTKVLQADAQNIMKNKQEQEGELPLFDEIAVQRLLDAFQPVPMKQAIHLGDGLQVTYYASGHIMGAAMLLIESEEGILLMSGDLSMSPQRAVVKAEIPRAKADFLVMESTYGGRLHANRAAEEKRLITTLKRVIDRGGKAIIPAFALGRAQEVLQILHAYRGEVDVPVWVDGMVRSVCRAYHTFQEYLPKHTVRAAKDDDLFFRDKVRAIKSPVQREEVARAEGPAIIVSSSGMLTGGPSVAYVKWLADDERNGVFLTGYQDEEAPGRFVQRMVSDREEGKEVTMKIDDAVVTLRCELGTYSLSAHADEAELISIAEAIDPSGVALVHGDGPARHSIAAGLRQRGKQVHLPVTGTSLELTFPKRPWALGVRSGSQSREKPLDPEALWHSLKDQAGSFFSARELAQAWWGDATREDEVVSVLTLDGVYFSQSWRRQDTFQVRSPEQVSLRKRQRMIMAANADLKDKLLVLRDVNGRVRVGVGKEARADSFGAVVAKAKGRNYPGDALVWVIGPYEELERPDDQGFMKHLIELQRQAEALRETVIPFEKRRALVKAGAPVNPEALVPAELPEGVTPLIAQLTIVAALAEDGAIWTKEGLMPLEVKLSEPMEQNLARQTVLALFPEESRLRKVGMDVNRHQITLYFDFPGPPQEKYAAQIETAADQTNWQVSVAPDVNQQALGTAVYDLLPPGSEVVKGPSYYIAQGMVQVDLAGVDDPEAVAAAYEALTGFKLIINDQKDAVEGDSPPASDEKLEINAAYGVIREALEAHGLYKTSLKQGRIVLSFISPQVGARHMDTIARLSRETGYELLVHPHPNQNAILQEARQLLSKANVRIRKGPSIYVDRGEVAVTVTQEPANWTGLCKDFEDATGYQLILMA